MEESRGRTAAGWDLADPTRIRRAHGGYTSRMSLHVHAEPLGDHDYLVRVADGRSTVESRFQATTEVVDMMNVPETDEKRVVEETVVFLAEHQDLVDLPQMVDLDDVAAAYDHYVDEVGRRLAAPRVAPR